MSRRPWENRPDQATEAAQSSSGSTLVYGCDCPAVAADGRAWNMIRRRCPEHGEPLGTGDLDNPGFWFR